MTLKRPSLLMLMAGAAALSTFAHSVNASGPGEDKAQTKAAPTRLGSAIQSEMSQTQKTARDRERQLELREQALKASEKRLKNNLQTQQAQPKQDRQTPVDSKAEKEAEEAETLDQLARIYQSMKPKQAAPVFEQLDIEVQIAVARKMRERSTAQILAAMTPQGAARLSMALAGKPIPRKRPRADPSG